MTRLALLLAALMLAAGPADAASKKSSKKKAAAAPELELALEPLPEEELALPDLETIPAAPVPEAEPLPPPSTPLEQAPPAGLQEVAPTVEPAPWNGARLRVTPSSGFGWTAETALGAATPVFQAGVGAAYHFTRDASLALDFSDQLYTRRYLTTRPAFGADAPFVELSEQKLSAGLLYGHELLRPLGVKDERFALQVRAGPSGHFFLNEAIRSQAAGVAAGGVFTFTPSRQLDVSVGGTWTWNLLDTAMGPPDVQLNAFGALRAWSEFEASVGLKLAPGTRLRLGYAGEVLTLTSSYRVFHTLSFAFDVHL